MSDAARAEAAATEAAATEAAASQVRWADALSVARLFARDPAGLGGVVVRGAPGAARDAWMDAVRAALGEDAPWRRLPVAVDDERLLGGVDLAASLAAGARVMACGLLAAAAGGVVICAMAERMGAGTAARIAGAMDAGGGFGVILLDEGVEDEGVAAALAERCAFRVELGALPRHVIPGLTRDLPFSRCDAGPTEAGRSRVKPGMTDIEIVRASAPAACSEEGIDALAQAAAAFGVRSMRGPLLALRAARAAAWLAGRDTIADEDIVLAARLVLAPRATRMPAAAEVESDADAPDDAGEEDAPPPPSAPDTPSALRAPPLEGEEGNAPLGDIVLEATRAAVPPGVLAAMEAGRLARAAGARGGAGALKKALRRGRPAGTRAGDPRTGARLDIAATLTAAAPWQRFRARSPSALRAPPPAGEDLRSSPAGGGGDAADGGGARLRLRREDFRVKRFVERAESTTVFVVDASGSAALTRLAEAKGAVELLLAEAYVRRTQVALIAFRGVTAELLLPPTRSLARAKRALADLAGGGGTPLGAAVEAAHGVALAARARARTPLVVMLTDGRANVSRDGAPGREHAQADALVAARLLCADGIAAALIDTAPRPRPETAAFAAAMGARYVALPRVDAGAMRDVVRGLDV